MAFSSAAHSQVTAGTPALLHAEGGSRRAGCSLPVPSSNGPLPHSALGWSRVPGGVCFTPHTSSSSSSSSSRCRRRGIIGVRGGGAAASSASVLEAATAERAEQGCAAITYLEGNSWLLDVSGLRFLVDPILEGPLDFGIPWLYTAFKKVLRSVSISDLAGVADYVLLTQSLDDHCHINTLRPLSALRPDIPIIATPNALPILSTLPFSQVIYLEPGEMTQVGNKDRAAVTVKATAGPVLGPPWQRPENGYILRCAGAEGVSLYLEPHCTFSKEELQEQDPVDVVISPVVKQMLPSFTLVSGQEDAVTVAKALRAKYIVPMANAELDATGVLSALVTPVGTLQSFEVLLGQELPGAVVLVPTPGVPLLVPRS